MKIKLLGAHNCESRDTRLTSLVIDDVLALDAGGLTSSLSFEAQKNLKAVLLTHHHYDHIRDVPTLAMNLYLAGASIDIYGTQPAYNTLTTHLLNGQIYPDFTRRPPEKPTIRFTVLEPYQNIQIVGYSVMAVPVNHSVPAIGYQIRDRDGKVLFYTGDTGPGLTDCWQQIAPQLLIIEVTASNKYADFGRESKHLTPDLLKEEMLIFKEIRGYLPQVVAIHVNPDLENEVRAELADVAKELGTTITVGYEGMQLDL